MLRASYGSRFARELAAAVLIGRSSPAPCGDVRDVQERLARNGAASSTIRPA